MSKILPSLTKIETPSFVIINKTKDTREIECNARKHRIVRSRRMAERIIAGMFPCPECTREDFYADIQNRCEKQGQTLLTTFSQFTKCVTVMVKCSCGNERRTSIKNIERSPGCKKCFSSHIDYDTIQEKMRATNMEKRGVEYATQDPAIRAKVRATNMERRGVECTTQDPVVRAKARATNMEQRGVEYASQDPEVKAKVRATNMEKRGVEHAMQDPAVQAKSRATNMEKRGVEYTAQDPAVRAKLRATNMEKRGVDHAMKDPTVQAKARATNMERRGVEYPMQDPNVIAKGRQTCMSRYGVPSPMQVPEIADRQEKGGYCYKRYTLPDGREIKVQGFEGDVLDYLFSIGHNCSDFIFGRSNVPKIWYTHTKKLSRYYTDFATAPNVMYEVKSTHTMKNHWCKNIAKFMASVYLGYELHVIVWERKSRKYEQLKAYIIFKKLGDFVDNVMYLAQACGV